MNWDSIRYIFQIPLSWYQKIHKRVFNAYGTNFLTVREGYYGGTEVGIDSDGFAAEVNRAVDLSGYVKSVDGQTPDENGNVELSGVVKTIDGEEPDENGNIELSDYYVTLDTDQTITGEKTFSQTINLSSYGALESDADYVRLAYGSTNGITIAGENNDRQQLLDDEPARLYSTGADNQIATRGYCRLNFARASELSGYVRSVNNTLPDENGNVSVDIPDVPENIVTSVNGQTGNVNLGNIVNSVNNIAPVNGNVTLDTVDMDDVEDYVGEQLTNYVQQTDLTDYVQQNELTNYALTSDLADYALTSDLADYALTSDLTDYVQTVDNIFPTNGNIDFNLDGNKWMKTDSNGHIATTNETPISLSAGNTGYLYANNGSLEFKQDEYVTLSTEQTITATKTFNNCNVVAANGGRVMVQETNNTGSGTSIGHGTIVLNGANGATFIDFSTGTTANDAFIMKGTTGLAIQDPTGVDLNAPANKATLTNHPTDTTTTSKAIATVGYCQEKFLAAPPTGYTPTTSNITVVTGVSWNGTQIVATRTQLRFYKGVFVGTTNQTNETINTVAYTP